MKYLKKFSTQSDFKSWQRSEECVQPNIVFLEDTREVSYNVTPLNGVVIQHIDGSFYTTDDWSAKGFTNDQANGVAVFDNRASFIIAKQRIGTMSWSSDTSNTVEDVVLTNDLATAKTDYAGESNTALIAATDTGKAAYSCANFTFPNGAKGYLPALGEWVIAYEYEAEINSAMSLIGGNYLGFNDGNKGYYWSSTQCSATHAWIVDSEDVDFIYKSKGISSFTIAMSPYYIYARPFTALNI